MPRLTHFALNTERGFETLWFFCAEAGRTQYALYLRFLHNTYLHRYRSRFASSYLSIQGSGELRDRISLKNVGV